MKINREKLLAKLQAIGPGLSSRGILEQSTHVAFRGGRAETFNDEVACSVEIPGLDVEGAVEADKLLKLLAKVPDEEVDVSVEGGELSVRGARRRAGLRIEAEIAVPPDAVETPERWRKVPDGLAEAFGVVRQCCSRDASQPVLVCVHVAPDRVEACDAFQAARWPIKTGLSKPILVRDSSLAAVEGCKPAEWAMTENWLHFRGEGGLTVSCRRFAQDYPELDEHLAADGVPVALPKDLPAAVDRASVFVERSGEELVRIEIRPGKLKITGRGPAGWFSEVLDSAYAGDPLSFSITPRLLLEVARKADEVLVGEGRLVVQAEKWRYVTCTYAEAE